MLELGIALGILALSIRVAYALDQRKFKKELTKWQRK